MIVVSIDSIGGLLIFLRRTPRGRGVRRLAPGRLADGPGTDFLSLSSAIPFLALPTDEIRWIKIIQMAASISSRSELTVEQIKENSEIKALS